jgi:Icc-related predicted phosphoesterase
MKILAVGDPHGDMKKLRKISKSDIDLVLCTGDVGSADFARKFHFENVKRQQQGLEKLEYDGKTSKQVYNEINDSSIAVWKYLSKIAPTYSILGNVGMTMIYDSNVKKEEKKYKIKLPYMGREMKKINNFYFVRNVVRNIDGLRVGFLEYFEDVCWDKEFGVKDKKKIEKAKEETTKAKRVLNNFGGLDILVCHQPPYGYLDKVSGKYGAPKNYIGKHAGSKTILDYVRKYQPKYVFCGHIHEGEGKSKIGKTEVYNLGVAGHKIVEI